MITHEILLNGQKVATYDPDTGYVADLDGDEFAQASTVKEARSEARDFFDSYGTITIRKVTAP